jgi:hypothetical protein
MAMDLITTNTSSGAASSDFTSSIDSTYKLYIFKFYDVNPATDATRFSFQGSIDGGSNYNVTITSSTFKAYHTESDSAAALAYDVETDQAQGTGYQDIQGDIGNASDESGAGELFLFNPSNTTYIKHFYSTVQAYDSAPQSRQTFAAGYFNTTSAIDAISFKMLSGNMDAVIKMYGVG